MENDDIKLTLLNGDEYALWLMNMLDNLENLMDQNLPASWQSDVKSKHDAILAARDAYFNLNNKSAKKKQILVEGE